MIEPQEPQEPQEISFDVAAIYGRATRSPLVTLTIGPHHLTLDPNKAREIAGMLLEVAEASEQDAFLFEFARDRLDVSEGQAAQLLILFRQAREDWASRGEAHDPHEQGTGAGRGDAH